MQINNIRSLNPGSTVTVGNGSAVLLQGKVKNRTCLLIQNTHGSVKLKVGSQAALTAGTHIEVGPGQIYPYYGTAPIYAQAASSSIDAKVVPIMGTSNDLGSSTHSQKSVTSTRSLIVPKNRKRFWVAISNIGASTVAIGAKNVLFGSRGFDLGAGQFVVLPGQEELYAINTGTNEVQTLTITGTLTAGTYTLSYDGYAAVINWNDNAAAIQAKLRANPSIGPDGVTVTGSGPYTITFVGELAAKNVAQITVNNSNLTGGTGAVATTTPGAPATAVTLNIREEKF